VSNQNNQEEQAPTTFFFPLRTNVHYFDSPEEQLALMERVKQSSLLYENLLFEGGIYDAVVWKDEERGGGPSFDMWIPPQDVTDDFLAGYEHKPTGGDAYLKIDEHVFASGEAERRQHAEFHSLLKQLNVENLPWIEMEAFGLHGELKNLAGRLALDDESALGDLLSDKPRFLKSKILSNLNHDLILTSQLNVAASMDGLFEPLLSRKAQRHAGLQAAPGFAAFQVAIPNLSHLSWSEVVDIREQESLKEFRRKIMEIEALARSMSSQGDVKDLQLRISQIITRELLKEISELIPKGTQVAADVICDVLLGFIPGASAVVTGLTGLGKLEAANSSWIAAFLKLNNPT
jgi:hypothetical protein